MLLALDQALKVSGYAIFDNNELVKYGTFEVKRSANMGKRLNDILQNIMNITYDYEIDKVVFEQIQMQAGNVVTYRSLAYVQAVIIYWCYINDIEFEILEPSRWRKILGKGWGRKREEQKEHAINLIKDWYDIDVTTDAADAICIGRAYIKDNMETIGFDS